MILEAASAYDKICTPNTSSYIYIWKSKSTDSEKVGKFSKGDGASILSSDADWLKIESGSVTGYVKKENVQLHGAFIIFTPIFIKKMKNAFCDETFLYLEEIICY